MCHTVEDENCAYVCVVVRESGKGERIVRKNTLIMIHWDHYACENMDGAFQVIIGGCRHRWNGESVMW